MYHAIRKLGGQARVLGRSATPEAAAQARAAALQRLGLGALVRHEAASGKAR